MLVLSLLGPMRRWSEWRAAVRELSTMSDGELKDVGLARDEIDDAVWMVLSRDHPPETDGLLGAKVGAVDQEHVECERITAPL
jgi:uncharacterized protein YjiS (DUF1127 family)